MSARFAVERLGDAALLLRFGERIDADCNAAVHACAAAIARQRPPWLSDLVPGYASLALFVDEARFAPAADPLAEAERWLREAELSPAQAPSGAARTVEVPVVYGGEHGPDLDAVAAHAGLAPQEVVRLHAAATYRVAMLGFAPGFPYLLGLDPRLAMPRLATPRAQVAAGSVGIGGAQTGIYPRAGPGGWRIIGRSDARLFDPVREPPTLLRPGDAVRFVAVAAP